MRTVIQFGKGMGIPSVWQRFGRCGRDGSRGRCIWILPSWPGPLKGAPKGEKAQVWSRQNFKLAVGNAALLYSAHGSRKELKAGQNSFNTNMVQFFKFERVCYRQLFMLYFGYDVNFLS